MFDEVPVVGTQYKTGDWKLYAAANDVEIKGFFGEYRWLSNFHICRVWFEGLCYPSSENAFQAAKIYPEHRHPFLDCSAAQSKKLWKENILLCLRFYLVNSRITLIYAENYCKRAEDT